MNDGCIVLRAFRRNLQDLIRQSSLFLLRKGKIGALTELSGLRQKRKSPLSAYNGIRRQGDRKREDIPDATGPRALESILRTPLFGVGAYNIRKIGDQDRKPKWYEENNTQRMVIYSLYCSIPTRGVRGRLHVIGTGTLGVGCEG